MEYLEKMIPHADLSFFGLGNGFGGKELEFRAKERGRAHGGVTKREKLMFNRPEIVERP